MSENGDRTVAVIIPMFNSTSTIVETLESVIGQTYTDLEIVVVDDGSTDDSVEKVRLMQGRDPRVRLVQQPNSGVAAARNNGAASTTAPYLAFVDADDLWAPEKVEAQMQLVDESKEPALVWCWCTHIDGEGFVLPTPNQYAGEGNLLEVLCRFDIIGNGSSLLMPRAVFEGAGGYEPDLRARGAQGCEDYLFALRAAEHFPLKVVTRHLVGYRVTDGNMSSNTPRMWRSLRQVCEEYSQKYPLLRTAIDENLRHMLNFYTFRSFELGNVPASYYFLKLIGREEPARLLQMIPTALKTLVIKNIVPTRFQRRGSAVGKTASAYMLQQW